MKVCSIATNKILCDDDDCNQCFNRSFASHTKAKFWSLENNKQARKVFKKTSIKYKFDCKCGHTFETRISDVDIAWCSYCGNRKLCTDQDCISCFNKSFASHEKSKYWSETNNKKSRDVFKNDNNKYKFNCICGHVFETELYVISCQNSWCPYCSDPPQKLCNDQSCEQCFKKSFASYEKSKYWSSLNTIKPRDIFKHTMKKYKFDCPSCNEIHEASPFHIMKGCWCSCTKKKTETKMYKFLLNNYKIKIIKQPKFKWCKNKNELPFDFLLEEFKLIIEVDGIQHFKQVMNWAPPEETQKIDKYKMDFANKNGYSVIRILQEDVWKDKNDWQKKLKTVIKKYINPINILIGNIYQSSNFKNDKNIII